MKATHRLRLRLTVLCAVGTGLVLTGMAAASFHYSARQLRLQAEQSFAATVNAICYYLREQPVLSHTWMAQTEADNRLWLHVQRGDAQLLYTRQDDRRAELAALALELAETQYGFPTAGKPHGTYQPETVTFELEHAGTRYRTTVCRIPLERGWLGVAVLQDQGRERSQIRGLALAFGGAVLLGLAGLLAFAWFFSRWVTRPVEESRRRQAEFISAASHELRSPLAVIQINAENSADAPPELVRRFSDSTLRECGRLSRLTEDLLQLAGTDSQRWSIQPEPVGPQSLLLDVLESFEGRAAQKDIQLTLSPLEEPLPPLRCDRQRVEQALHILLDNALEYTPAGGKIHLGLCQRRRRLLFLVQDSGPGVPPDQRERIFDRFYRGEASRTGKEHYGLGLSIAREIAQLHGGGLTVGESALGGALFALSLPLSRG